MSDIDLRVERVGKFRVTVHRPSRSVECEMEGFWSRDDGAHFCCVVEEELAHLRQTGSPARAMFDMSLSRLQLFTAMSLPRSKTMILAGDRVAVVVTSPLLRLAMKQQPVLTSDHAYFEDNTAARAWLRESAQVTK